jgi:hypothetical protein
MLPQPRRVWYLHRWIRIVLHAEVRRSRHLLFLHVARRDVRAQLLVKRRCTRDELQEWAVEAEISVTAGQFREVQGNLQKPNQRRVGRDGRSVEGRTLRRAGERDTVLCHGLRCGGEDREERSLGVEAH